MQDISGKLRREGFATAARNAGWYALVPAAGVASGISLYLLAFLSHSWPAAALLLAAAGLFQYSSLGPSFGVVQNVVGVRRRATATALLYLCLTLALAGGPLFTGWLIDRLFGASCAIGALGGACAPLLARATRLGLIATLFFQAWAAVHYALGAIGLGRQMELAGGSQPSSR